MATHKSETMLLARAGGSHYHVESCARVRSDKRRYRVIIPEWQPHLMPCPDCIALQVWQNLIEADPGSLSANGSRARRSGSMPRANVASSRRLTSAAGASVARSRRAYRRTPLLTRMPPRRKN